MATRPWRGDVKIVDQWMSHYRVAWRGKEYEIRVDTILEESDIWEKRNGQKARLALPREEARRLKLCR